jgi:hypothetical protein
VTIAHWHGDNDKRTSTGTTGKGDHVFLDALERGQTISARKFRKVVGVVYSIRAYLPRQDMK